MRRRKRKQKTPEQMRRRASRRQRLFRMVGRIVFLGILLAAALLALTVFFRVETISVEGAVKYRAEELVAGMDVKQGDNLYLWNKVKVSDAMLERFPYLETVQIRRHLPNALVVTVTECSAAVAVPNDSGYMFVSAQGKLLEQSATNNGMPTVVGMALTGVTPGQMLSADDNDETAALLDILQNLDAADMLSDLAFLNLSDLTDIHIGYQERFDIQVGAADELAYHLRFAQTVINERLSPSDIGRLYWDAQNRLHFIPDTAENVARAGMASAGTDVAGQTGTADGTTPAGQADAADGTGSVKPDDTQGDGEDVLSDADGTSDETQGTDTDGEAEEDETEE